MKLLTPLGPGTYEGRYIDGRLLVRLPVNAETQKHLGDENCLTHRAVRSGLWLFDRGEVK